MIARSFVLFLLLLVLPYLYIDLKYFRQKKVWWKRVLLYLPCVAMVAYASYLAMERDFIPGNDRMVSSCCLELSSFRCGSSSSVRS